MKKLRIKFGTLADTLLEIFEPVIIMLNYCFFVSFGLVTFWSILYFFLRLLGVDINEI